MELTSSIHKKTELASSIHKRLEDLSKTSKNPFMFRVHEKLRRQNKKAYEPEIISIGPYHRGKQNLKKMEEYKLKYLQGILKRRGDASVDRFVEELRKHEEEVRDCYPEPIRMSSDKFVEMMILDGCFIIEFLRKVNRKNELIFNIEWYLSVLCRDLLLFENQLPFFILELLFDMTKIEDDHDKLIPLSIYSFKTFFQAEPSEEIKPSSPFHLLGLMHEYWCSNPNHSEEESCCIDLKKGLCCTGDQQSQSRCTKLKKCLHINDEQPQDPFIKSACELKKYGIKFEIAKGSKSCLDIKFDKCCGKMEIPNLTVDDQTETILRNLIAYEQYITVDAGSSRLANVTDYITFMDCLINSSKDVQVLCDKKIISNWLGSNEQVSKMINNSRINVYSTSNENYYDAVFKDVKDYCSRPWNEWIADLKTRYFYNPWAIISFVAGIILILLTFLQAICSFPKLKL